ncbi:MAG: preprotein translocase subunit SecE [Candidatus Saccharibacteria bacterium]
MIGKMLEKLKLVKKTDKKSVKNLKATKLGKKVVLPKKEPKGVAKVLFAIGGYFKGAWIELRQVRWTTRKATWSLTLAVILFTVFFFLLILLLDFGFKELFNLILK